MKDYLLILIAVVGFFVMFFGIELNKENLMLQQIFGGIGMLMFGLIIPIDLMLDMLKDEKKKKKEED